MSWLRSLNRRWGGRAAGREEAQAEALRRFRAAVTEGLDGDRGALEQLRRMPAELGLDADEVDLDLEKIQGAIDLCALRDAVAHTGLPTVPHQHKALGADRCHFLASASITDEGGIRTGRLFLTDRRLVFLASPTLALSWSAIGSVVEHERDILVRTVTPGDGYQFRCNSLSDARCGAFIARRILQGTDEKA